MARFVLLGSTDLKKIRLKPDTTYRTTTKVRLKPDATYARMTHEQKVTATAACAMFGSLLVRSIGLAAGIGLGILLAAALLFR